MRAGRPPMLYASRAALFIQLVKNAEKTSSGLRRLSHPLILLAHFRVGAFMNRAAPAAATFKEAIDLKLLTPVQRNLFTGEPEPIHVDIDHAIPEDETEVDDGISLVKTEDSAQLILSGFGLYLGKKSERLIVRKGKEVVYQFPFFRIQEVVVASKGISISSDLLEELCVRGIRLNFWGMTGKPYALITSPHLNATIQTRRDQLQAFNDHRGFEFSRSIVEGKIRNQEKLLRYFAKYLKD